MMLPAIETDPMTAPARLNPDVTWSPSATRSSTAAIAPAAPPPIPLKIATIWGIAVIWTTRAQYQPANPPIATPTAMRAKFDSPGSSTLTATAMSIATPARTIPRRAVVGELIERSPRMKTMIARV